MSDLTDRLRERHREMPHRFPTDADGEVLAWRCGACGEWINELSPRTRCTVDWRAPYLEHEAAAALDAAEAENARLREDYGNLAAELGQVVVGYRQQLAAIDALHQPSPKNSDVQWCGHCNRWWPCPTHRILHPEDEQ